MFMDVNVLVFMWCLYVWVFAKYYPSLSLWCINSYAVILGSMSFRLCAEQLSHVTPVSLSAGQLGDCRGTTGRTDQCTRASEAGGLFAQEEEMAHEGLAQGGRSSWTGSQRPLQGENSFLSHWMRLKIQYVVVVDMYKNRYRFWTECSLISIT